MRRSGVRSPFAPLIYRGPTNKAPSIYSGRVMRLRDFPEKMACAAFSHRGSATRRSMRLLWPSSIRANGVRGLRLAELGSLLVRNARRRWSEATKSFIACHHHTREDDEDGVSHLERSHHHRT